jgi:hypothetical protein
MILSAIAFTVLAAPKQTTLTVANVLAATAKYDNKTVAVKGTVARFRDSGTYYLFKLSDNGKQLSIYGQGKLKTDPSDGATVIVTGQFAHERHVGSRTYKDEIDASAKLDKTYGVVIKGAK